MTPAIDREALAQSWLPRALHYCHRRCPPPIDWEQVAVDGLMDAVLDHDDGPPCKSFLYHKLNGRISNARKWARRRRRRERRGHPTWDATAPGNHVRDIEARDEVDALRKRATPGQLLALDAMLASTTLAEAASALGVASRQVVFARLRAVGSRPPSPSPSNPRTIQCPP